MTKALYRKYRPKSLNEIIGQKHITDILSRAILQENVSHAYLLTGPRGVGKTSIARILAHEINGLKYDEKITNLDIIEIDAASNNGVEDVRDLREKVQIAPVSAKKKIYIIDEVHMLSKPAFNALLKTLEEPPEHIVFILATTNAEKLPATIISRTQRFSFRPISIEDAAKQLKFIADKEKIKIDTEALQLIAERSDGSFRDSISLLDQMSNLVISKSADIISAKLIEDTLGLASSKTINQILDAVEAHDIKNLVETLDNAVDEGISAVVLANQITIKIRDQIIVKPQLIYLLDGLIDVDKSPHSQMKLLSVLGQFAAPKQPVKTMALSSPKPRITATIAELEQIATKDNNNKTEVIAPISNSINNSSETTGCFEWIKFIDYAKQNFIAIYSVLSKCNYVLDDKILTIYTGNKFYKKKLDDPKYRPLLSKCIEGTCSFELDIHTIATALPPKDSQAAAIVAMMGGGEEVSLEAV